VIIAQAAVRTAEDAMRLIMNVPKTSPDWARPIQPSDMPAVVEMTPDMDAAVAFYGDSLGLPMRMRHGAPGVICSAVTKPSRIHR